MNSKTSDRPSDLSPAPGGDVREATATVRRIDTTSRNKWVGMVNGNAVCQCARRETALRIAQEKAALAAGDKAAAVADRERIARIIDPDGWRIRDRHIKGATDYPGLTGTERENAIASAEAYVRSSLAKADAVLAIHATTPATSRDRLEREALDLLSLQQIGRARALRLLDGSRKTSDPETLASADAYEECGKELRAALQALGGSHE